jgi:tetratricopeptide (TPR) repeat protein
MIREYYLGLAVLTDQVVRKEVDVKGTIRLLRPELGNLFTVLRELAKAPDVTDVASEAIIQTTWLMYLHSVPTTDLLTLLLENKNFKPSDRFRARSMYLIGSIHQICRRYNASLKASKEAEDLFASLGWGNGLADCEVMVAEILEEQSKFEEATAMYNKAKHIYESLGDNNVSRGGISDCLLGLANIASARGQLKQARSMSDEAIKLSDLDRIRKAYCRMNLTFVDTQLGKYQEAVDALREILEEFRIADDLYDIGQCLSRLCYALLYLGEYDQVKVYAEEGRSIGKTQSDNDMYASCIRHLGYVCLHQRSFPDAESLFNQALSIFDDIGDPIGIADTKFALARVMLERGDKDNAGIALNELLLEYRTMEYQIRVAKVLIMLSKCYQQDSDGKGQASAHLREAVATELEESVSKVSDDYAVFPSSERWFQ